jgi:hypothetical protein
MPPDSPQNIAVYRRAGSYSLVQNLPLPSGFDAFLFAPMAVDDSKSIYTFGAQIDPRTNFPVIHLIIFSNFSGTGYVFDHDTVLPEIPGSEFTTLYLALDFSRNYYLAVLPFYHDQDAIDIFNYTDSSLVGRIAGPSSQLAGPVGIAILQ